VGLGKSVRQDMVSGGMLSFPAMCLILKLKRVKYSHQRRVQPLVTSMVDQFVQVVLSDSTVNPAKRNQRSNFPRE
jgi:hypothetical protein